MFNCQYLSVLSCLILAELRDACCMIVYALFVYLIVTIQRRQFASSFLSAALNPLNHVGVPCVVFD
jgi:hypothetical protein